MWVAGELGSPRLDLPILLPPYSTNHRLPSGPMVIPIIWALPVGIGNSVITPAAVILPKFP